MSEWKTLTMLEEDRLDGLFTTLLGFKTEIREFHLWIEFAGNGQVAVRSANPFARIVWRRGGRGWSRFGRNPGRWASCLSWN